MRKGFLVPKPDPTGPVPPTVLTLPTLRVPDLPPEITDRILDHLHADTETLRQCSLVVKHWVPRSRYYAFNSIVLKGRSKCQVLQSLLESNPNLGYFVKELKIMTTFEEPPWLSTDVPELTKKLPLVYRLEVEGNGICSAATFREFPNVRELTIERGAFETFNEFVGTICNLPSLQDLTCINALIGDSPELDAPPPTEAYPRPKLRKLEFRATRLDSQMFADWFVGDGMYETVEDIVVRPMQRFHLENVGRMIKAVGPNLKRFEIALIAMQMQGGFDDVFATSFSLEPCVNLTSLTFGSPGGYSVLYHTDDKSCRWIEIMLSQITSKVISEISFWVDEEDVVKIRTGKWDGIISLLLSKKFGSLKKVELKLREDNKMVMDAVESFMKRRLNKLHKDGVLVFVRNWRPPDI